jgi:hypothetical protein
MITVLIRAEKSVEALAATFAALVPGVAEGLVADAVVISTRNSPELAAVADAVGAGHFLAQRGKDPWFGASATARRNWLLCLQAGDVPMEGWIGAIERFVDFEGEPRIGCLSGPTARAGAANFFERCVGATAARPGHLVHRALLGEAGLARRTRPLRVAARLERLPGA